MFTKHLTESDMKDVQQHFSLLLVDDEPPILKLLEETFAENNYNIHTASDGKEALEILRKVKIDALLTDLVMPEMDGIDLIKQVKQLHPSTMVIMITANGGVKDAVHAIKLGADDFLEKPFSPDGLRVRVAQLFKMWELQVENQKLRESVQKIHFGFHGFIGNSTPILKLKEMIARVGITDSSILIQGETGTGKELVARALHHHSSRAKNNFVPVDCAAISESVIESELFGHVKGAFTNAHTAALGLIRAADKGTLFLDEIGELSPVVQAKLLRTLQEKEVRPVGSNRCHPVDVRLLAATNRNLKKHVDKGNFREDLFYRINVLTINIPPLRDRKEDILLLARYFLSRIATDISPVKEISQEALICLENYEWPGNVRELENIIQRAVALAEGNRIHPEDLPSHIYCSPSYSSQNNGFCPDDSLQAYEIAAIKNALTKSSYKRIQAAQLLGIGEATLYRKIKKYNLQS